MIALCPRCGLWGCLTPRRAPGAGKTLYFRIVHDHGSRRRWEHYTPKRKALALLAQLAAGFEWEVRQGSGRRAAGFEPATGRVPAGRVEILPGSRMYERQYFMPLNPAEG